MRNKQNGAMLRWFLKHFVYLGILALMISFAVLPLHGIMKANTIRNFLTNQDPAFPLAPSTRYYYTRELSRNFLFYPMNQEITCLIFGALGLGSALVLFGHLFSKKQSMMYAALPQTRGGDFLRRGACFCLLVMVPLVCCALIYPAAISAMGLGEFFDTGLYLREALVIALITLYGYMIGALSAQLFGTLWSALLGGLLLVGSLEMIFRAWYAFTMAYLHTMVPQKYGVLLGGLSPLISLYKGLYQADQFHPLPSLAAILLFGALGLLAARRNRSERAGATLNFLPLETPLHALVAVLGGSLGGLIFAVALEPEYCLYLGLAAGVLVASLLLRMLLEQNIRVRRFPWRVPAVCLAVLLLGCLGLRVDLFGYDRYLPDLSDVRAFAWSQEFYSGLSQNPWISLRESENLDRGRQWAGLMRDETVANRKRYPFQRYSDAMIRVRWTLTSGASVTRQYPALEDQLSARPFVQSIADSGEYRAQLADALPDYKEIYGSSSLQFSLNMQDEDFQAVYGFSRRISLDRVKSAALREAYQADLSARSWEDVQGIPVFSFWFSETDPETDEYRSSENYQVYASDTRTIRAVLGNRADQVMAWLNGGWADTEELLVFRCVYEQPDEASRTMTSCTLASGPDQAREWVSRTSQCQNQLMRAPVNPLVEIRLYAKPVVRLWAERENREELLTDPDFWNSLPAYDELYSFLTLQERTDL